MAGQSADVAATSGTRQLDDTIDTASDDPAMNHAILEARAHLHVFESALKKAEPGMSFAVKKPFPTNAGPEHMWLVDVRAVAGGFEGRLDNEPRDAVSARPGNRYVVARNELSDWNYTDREGRMWGNYTARVLLPQLEPKQKKALEEILQPLP